MSTTTTSLLHSLALPNSKAWPDSGTTWAKISATAKSSYDFVLRHLHTARGCVDCKTARLQVRAHTACIAPSITVTRLEQSSAMPAEYGVVDTVPRYASPKTLLCSPICLLFAHGVVHVDKDLDPLKSCKLHLLSTRATCSPTHPLGEKASRRANDGRITFEKFRG